MIPHKATCCWTFGIVPAPARVCSAARPLTETPYREYWAVWVDRLAHRTPVETACKSVSHRQTVRQYHLHWLETASWCLMRPGLLTMPLAVGPCATPIIAHSRSMRARSLEPEWWRSPRFASGQIITTATPLPPR